MPPRRLLRGVRFSNSMRSVGACVLLLGAVSVLAVLGVVVDEHRHADELTFARAVEILRVSRDPELRRSAVAVLDRALTGALLELRGRAGTDPRARELLDALRVELGR